MNATDGNQLRARKKLFSPQNGVLQTPSPGTPVRRENHPPRQRESCTYLDDCIRLCCFVSQGQGQNFKLQRQVGELEKEIQRQRDLKATYKARLEKVQDYVRYCLQIAQENGFLDLISKNSLSPPPSHFNLEIMSQSPSSNSQLSTLRQQAKQNGWYIEKNEIELHEQVGQGSTADIYRGSWRGTDVAVKCMYPTFFESCTEGVNWFIQELETLSRQHHPFVLRLMGACLNPPKNAWLVMEFLTGTLTEWLHGHRGRQARRTIPLPPLKERITKALEIAQAMQYLHEQKPKLIHRDLKPSNIFIDDSMHVRVADFGHARFLPEGEQALTGETGTYVYMAPEVIRCEPYNEKCDVYSFGVILNELITGQPPYINLTYGPIKIALEVGEGRLRPTLPADGGQLGIKELITLIQCSWDGDASIRPSFAIITCAIKRIQQKITGETADL